MRDTPQVEDCEDVPISVYGLIEDLLSICDIGQESMVLVIHGIADSRSFRVERQDERLQDFLLLFERQILLVEE